jgi:hypothetical protein
MRMSAENLIFFEILQIKFPVVGFEFPVSRNIFPVLWKNPGIWVETGAISTASPANQSGA